MSGCGHMVHEDNPDKVSQCNISGHHMISCDLVQVAKIVATFLVRHKLAQGKDLDISTLPY